MYSMSSFPKGTTTKNSAKNTYGYGCYLIQGDNQSKERI